MSAAKTVPGPNMVRLSDANAVIPSPNEDIRGLKATDRDGESLGKISDLLVDEDSLDVMFLIVDHGGTLGIGAKQSFLPVEAVTYIAGDEVQVDTELDVVAEAPIYDPGVSPESSYYDDVYNYYGITPYWVTSASMRERL